MQKHIVRNLGAVSFQVAVVLAQALLWSSIVLSSVFNISCSVTTEGIQILAGDYEAPQLQSVLVESDRVVSVCFLEEVSVLGITLSEVSESVDENAYELSPSLYSASGSKNAVPVSVELQDNGKKVVCNLSESTQIGKKYILFGEVEDKNGNSLTFTAPVTGFNSHAATLVLSEIQDKSTVKGGAEFIELYVLEPGNVSGIVLSSANDGENYDFPLPALEVFAGEIITVHLRTAGDGCVSEYGSDLTLSTAPGSSAARDIWSENSESRLGTSQDVILLKNGNTGTVLDAFLYTRAAKTEWIKPAVADAALEANKSGAWPSGAGVCSVFQMQGTTTQCIFVRTNIADLDALAEKGMLPPLPVPVYAENWCRVTPANVSPGFLQ